MFRYAGGAPEDTFVRRSTSGEALLDTDMRAARAKWFSVVALLNEVPRASLIVHQPALECRVILQ
jgi:hypothetical protein